MKSCCGLGSAAAAILFLAAGCATVDVEEPSTNANEPARSEVSAEELSETAPPARPKVPVNPEELFTAIEQGQIAKVRALLDAGADPNSVNSKDLSALMYALIYGDNAIVRLLVDSGAAIDRNDANGATPLMIAAYVGNLDGASYLIDLGADVNATERGTEATPLHYAATRDRAEVAKLLLQHGAKLEARDRAGRTPLMNAVHSGNRRVAETLVKAGSDLRGADDRGWPILMLAVDSGSADTVKLLVDAGAEIDATNASKGTSVMVAAAQNKPEILELLAGAGANLDLRDSAGWSALMLAAHYGYSAVVKLLTKQGANPDLQNSSGATAMMIAAGKGNAEIVDLLRNAGADTQLHDKQGRTVLEYSIASLASKMMIKRDVAGCVKLSEAAWKDGADQVTVGKSAINFESLTPNSGADVHERYQRILWDTFANKCPEDQFSRITAADWREKWSFYSAKLVGKATPAGFSDKQLALALSAIDPGPKSKRALLPVGAYLDTSDSGDVWIIVCKWEYAAPNDEGIYLNLGHLCGWVVRDSDQQVLTFFTCM